MVILKHGLRKIFGKSYMVAGKYFPDSSMLMANVHKESLLSEDLPFF